MDLSYPMTHMQYVSSQGMDAQECVPIPNVAIIYHSLDCLPVTNRHSFGIGVLSAFPTGWHRRGVFGGKTLIGENLKVLEGEWKFVLRMLKGL